VVRKKPGTRRGHRHTNTRIHNTDITSNHVSRTGRASGGAERERDLPPTPPTTHPTRTGIQHRLALRNFDARTRREVCVYMYICMYNTYTQLHVCMYIGIYIVYAYLYIYIHLLYLYVYRCLIPHPHQSLRHVQLMCC